MKTSHDRSYENGANALSWGFRTPGVAVEPVVQGFCLEQSTKFVSKAHEADACWVT